MTQDTHSPTSLLGYNPTCDICGKYIAAGEYVRQVFSGTVAAAEHGELGIVEQTYSLVHVVCLDKRYSN